MSLPVAPSRLAPLFAVALAAGPGSATAAGAAPASKDAPMSQVERKNRAPVSKEVLGVRLPRPVEATLDNGLAVLVLEDTRFPTVQVQMQIGGAGPIHEPADVPGLSDATARMMTEGAAGRSSEALAREIAALGAGIEASARFGSTDLQLSASGLSDNFDAWFALIADILLRPDFPADELEKMKMRLRVRLKQQRASPRYLAQEQFRRAVFRDHPAAVVSTSESALETITPDRLRAWHRERIVPQRSILGVAGDVRAEQLIPMLNRILGGWKPAGGPEPPTEKPGPIAKRRLIVIDRPGSVQTRLVLGGLAIDRRDPDYIPLTVMNRVLGGSAAARLFLNLRENKGYTYGVYSRFSALKYPGAWQAQGDVRTEVTGGAMKEFLHEFRRIRDEAVPADELVEAQRSLVARFALSLEKPDQLLGYALVRKIYGLPATYWDDYPAKVMAVTPDDVMRVAKRYLDLERLQVVAVGDAAKVRPVLEPLGTVEVFDTDGKPATR
jgi:zinc protease